MKVEEFLTKHLISPDCYNLDELCSFIMTEMEAGLEGKNSSLEMFDSYCSPSSTLLLNKKVAIIDAGGTNLRTCLVHFDKDGEPVIEDFQKTSMPGVVKEVSYEEFFNTFAERVERFTEITDTFGFCFSYATKILPDHDGIPMQLSKAVKAPSVAGKSLRNGLFSALTERGHDMSQSRLIVLNDTVTTLLAGLSQTEKLGCEGCVGFILGTGTNTAIMTRGTIINEESGNLRLPHGNLDSLFISRTLEKEYHTLEKLVGGAYLGPLALTVLKEAVKEGLFSENFSSFLCSLQNMSTSELCSYLEHPDKGSDEDKNVFRQIVTALIKRAAKYSAANLAASILFTSYGKDKPVLINADGTTFYKTPLMKQSVEEYLIPYLAQKGRKVVFTQIPDSPVIGSAIGALSLLS